MRKFMLKCTHNFTFQKATRDYEKSTKKVPLFALLDYGIDGGPAPDAAEG
jgi:hypothetical protein